MKILKSKSNIAHKTYLYSDEMLLNAANELIKAVTVKRTYDIPYLAGYNTEGTVVYIDRDVPKSHRFEGKKYSLDRYLIVHEVVEKVFEETLGLNYYLAHQCALRIERAAIEADGLSWEEYDRLMQTLIKTADHEKIKRVPTDLDYQPYKNCNDFKLIEHMKKHIVPEKTTESATIKELLNLTHLQEQPHEQETKSFIYRKKQRNL